MCCMSSCCSHQHCPYFATSSATGHMQMRLPGLPVTVLRTCSTELNPTFMACADRCEVQVRSLLLRDPHAARQPYKAAIEDTMILTMKGISSGMQNTG